jgi:cell division protein FtsL
MMLRLGIASLIVAVVAACALYLTKDTVRRLEGELRRLQAELADERVTLSRLRTEWAMLNQPGRLARLASAHLQLQPARPGQLVRVEDVPLRIDLEWADREMPAVLPSGAEVILRFKPEELSPVSRIAAVAVGSESPTR